MKKRILIIEDDQAILRGLQDNLQYESYEILSATDGETGYKLWQNERPDLVILDVMLPKLNGYDVCRRARKENLGTPILMLTARSDEVDRVMGLDLGADDYVTKPFSIAEVLARVRALLRRSASPSGPSRLQLGDVEVDFQSYEARKAGRALKLAPKEFGVLRLLASRPGEVVTRDELLNEVWGYDSYPTTRTVDNHVAAIRSKIEDDPSSPRYLLTIHGVGYKLVDVEFT